MQFASTSSTDPLIETQIFWVRHKTEILVALLALLLGTLGFGAYRFYQARQNAAAAELLARARQAADYEKVLAEFPGTTAAPSAAVLLAAKQRDNKQFAEANATLQAFLKKNPKHEFVTIAKMATAGNLESLGKPEEALETYRRIAAEHPRSFNAPLAMLAEVHLLKQKGQIEEARRVCETVLAQYRDSYAAAEASRNLRLLKPAAVALGASATEQSPAAVGGTPAASAPPP